MDTVVVSSSSEQDIYTTVSVIPIDQSSSSNIADILDSLPGIQIRRYGTHSELTIRGASAGQLLVTVDGIPVGNAQSGTTNLVDIPLNRFESVEVYRGNSPAMFGSRGTAGAVNFVSKDAVSNGTSLHLSAGSFGALGASTTATTENSLISLYVNRADNDYEYFDHNQTFANSSDDTVRSRVNAQFEEQGGFLNITGNGFLISSGLNKKTSGRPGPIGGHQSPHASLENLSADIRMQIELCGKVNMDLIARTVSEKLYDDYSEVGWDPAGTTESKSTDQICRVGVDNYGIEFRNQIFHQEHTWLVDPKRHRKSMGMFAAKVYNFNKLSIKPTVRWQKIRDDFPPITPIHGMPPWPTVPRDEADFSPTIAVMYGMFEGHVSRLVRQPNWVELFGHRGGVAGNQGLLPEKIVTADAGIRHGNYKAMLFATKTDDTIIFLQNSQYTSMAQNIGGSRIFGVELEGRGKIGKVRWNSNLTWQSARDRGDSPVYFDKELPMLPSLQSAVKLSAPFMGWRFSTTAEYESASYRNRYNTDNELAPDRLLLHTQLKRTWSRHYDWTLAVEAKNLTNNSVYDVEGFPLPGRSFAISLIVN
jgi:outer membrane cobalamin receptor